MSGGTSGSDWDEIPLVDFSSFAVDVADDDVDVTSVDTLARTLCDAFSTVGFAYLQNHGIPQDLVGVLYADNGPRSWVIGHGSTEYKCTTRGVIYAD